MKKLFITLILVTPIFLFNSCKREMNSQHFNTYSNNHLESKLITTFSTLGKIHNEGLDTVYSELKRNINTLNQMSNNYEKHDLIYLLINKSIRKFVVENLQVANINIDETLETLFKDSNTKILFGKDIVIQTKTTIKSKFFCPTYFLLLNKIDSLINRNAEENAYTNLIVENINSLDEDFEKMQFVSSASIAYNSNKYWRENYSKWNLLLNPNYVEKKVMSAEADPNTDPNKTATDIAKADVSGIIYGAVIGCGVGAVGGTVALPVVGTVAGCTGMGAVGAITGGLGGSAKTAVDKFVDWLTK